MPDLPKPPNDPNTYVLGSVIACLPKGRIGNNPAVTVAASMISPFPAGLMVGIDGDIPPKVRTWRCRRQYTRGIVPGVVQWDVGKAKDVERTGSLNNPLTSLLTALAKT